MINEVVKYSNNQGRFITPREIIENAFWYVLSSKIGILQPKILLNGKTIPLNYFGISIAGSSSGKDMSTNNMKRLLNINDSLYSETISKGLERAQAEIPSFLSSEGKQITIDKFIPKDTFININGTNEGLYLRALAISKSFCGSLNIINGEILDEIKDGNLNKMKELYDGHYNAKIIKGEINHNIYNLNANMLIYGASTLIKKDFHTYNLFNSSLSSGIYRRSFIYYQEPMAIKRNLDKPEVDYSIIEFIQQNVSNFINDNIGKRLEGGEIIIDIEPSEKLYEIDEHLINFANENIEDERFSAEVGSFDKIVKLAVLHSIVRGSSINDEDYDYAFDFYLRCRNTTTSLFNTEPQHLRIYKIIKRCDKITKSGILEKDIFTRSTFNEDMKLVEELCYRKNEQLTQHGSKIVSYSIEPLPATDLNKMIVSVTTEPEKKAKSTKFKNLEIPFFGSEMCVESLVKTKDMSFALCHFEGTRSDKNAIEGQNMIAFDIDGGMSLDEALKIFKPFTYIIYTTKSHQKDKGDSICDRFRVLLPTKFKFSVNQDQHKKLIENIAELLEIPSYDIATRNISRLWFSNDEAIIYKNENELLDVLCCIPDTEQEERTNEYISTVDVDDIEPRLHGMVKWTIANAYKGNRNNSLFKLFMFCLDMGYTEEEAKDICLNTNEKLQEPTKQREILAFRRR